MLLPDCRLTQTQEHIRFEKMIPARTSNYQRLFEQRLPFCKMTPHNFKSAALKDHSYARRGVGHSTEFLRF